MDFEKSRLIISSNRAGPVKTLHGGPNQRKDLPTDFRVDSGPNIMARNPSRPPYDDRGECFGQAQLNQTGARQFDLRKV